MVCGSEGYGDEGDKREDGDDGWRLRSGEDLQLGQQEAGSGGGVIWEKPRCSGCEKADVPCVFELAAASSG